VSGHYLLDTHVLLWLMSEPERLAPRHRKILGDNPVFVVSAVSVWEIAIKSSIGRLKINGDLLATVRSHSSRFLPITEEHAAGVERLPRHHGDPFDRLLVSQAMIEKLPLMTSDRRLKDYGVTLA